LLLLLLLQHNANKGKTSKQQAHVIIRYTVPPSAQEAFLDAWNQAEKGEQALAMKSGVLITKLLSYQCLTA
jgi:hypothetical protein